MKKILWIIGSIGACIAYFITTFIIFWAIGLVMGIFGGPTASQLTSSDLLIVLDYLGWLVLIILSVIYYKKWKMKCSACKRWGAMERVKTEMLSQENISVRVEVEHRNLERKVVGTQDQYVPGTRSTYKDTYKCKYCGNLQSNIYKRDQANI